MNSFHKRSLRSFLVLASVAFFPVAFGASSGWKVANPTKHESDVPAERSIERRRVSIKQRTRVSETPGLFRDQLEMESARRIRLEEKTAELISQLEALIQRPGQQERIGELRMRLAELYFERAQAVAARESEAWEKQVQAWDESKGARPILKTPQADRLRARALVVYQDLEKMSRGADAGKSKMIRRDDVLFFLASTLSDLNRAKESRPFYEELVAKFPQSPRLFAGRLALADLYFDTGAFEKAIPHYLRVAAGEGAPAGATEEVASLKAYGLYKLAWCYLNTGAFDKAVLALQRTVDASKGASSEQRLAFKREALHDLARAFALAGQYKEGEQWFESSGNATPEVMRELRRNIVDAARDRGDWKTSIAAIDQLLAEEPKSPGARDLALERVNLIGKRGDQSVHAKELAAWAKTYGEGSSWLSAQDMKDDEKKLLVEDTVAEIRRNAKTFHKAAQVRNHMDSYKAARAYYAAYFEVVPSPNPDKPENIHEMRFYQAELLYKLGEYKAAADAYAQVGEGKYASVAAYSRIASLKAASGKDKDLKTELAQVTEEFIAKNPQDERAADLLYSNAYESFEGGEEDVALKELRRVVDQYPKKSMGVESSERILFLHEKKNDIDGVIRDTEAFLGNADLKQTGGKEYVARIQDYRNRALFKKAETAPESSPEEQVTKGRAYYELSKTLQGELREKSLNNALVYARKGGDEPLSIEIRNRLVKEYPDSKYSRDIYLELGDAAIKDGRWAEALKNYDAYLKRNPDPKDGAVETVQWNRLYIQTRLAGFWRAEAEPKDPPAEMVKEAWAFFEKYPDSKHREPVIEFLAARKSTTPEELAKLRRAKGLTKKEQEILNEVALMSRIRKARKEELPAIVKANPPEKATTESLKEALGRAKFNLVEPEFTAYTKKPLDYKPARFAASLKSKMSELDKLDKQYMAVVAYGNAQYALTSLERLSKLYRTLAADIEKVPEKVPGVKKEDLAPYTQPLNDKGVGFIKKCLEKSTEFKISGAGVDTCIKAAAETGIETPKVTYEILPEPRWVPPSASDTRSLMKILSNSLGQNRFGEFHLALELLEGAKPPLTDTERGELANLTGLAEYRLHENQAAARMFRQASESDSDTVRTAALKNLGALYLQVRDYQQAVELMGGLNDADVDVAWIKGLALVGVGKPQDALVAYDAGLASAPNARALLYNRAIATAAAGDYAAAANAMARYVEVESPPGGHPSRNLLREWRTKVK